MKATTATSAPIELTCQNKTKVGLKGLIHCDKSSSPRRQNKTKVGLKALRKGQRVDIPLRQNKTKVGLKVFMTSTFFSTFLSVRIRLR